MSRETGAIFLSSGNESASRSPTPRRHIDLQKLRGSGTESRFPLSRGTDRRGPASESP